MTEDPRPARRRLSSRALRTWAWVTGLATFASPAVALGLEPKPATVAATADGPRRAIIVRRTITRRVIVRHRSRPSGVRYVYTSGAQAGGTTSTGSGGGAPAPAPAATTGGS
jgi:hypothetical protein